MAVARRASGTATLTPNTHTNSTVTKPAGTTNGDVMIAQMYIESTSTVTPPTGWTELTGSPVVGTNNDTRFYWKIAASEGASWTWTHASAWTGMNVSLYSGGDGTTPLDPSNHITSTKAVINNTSATITATGFTVAQGSELLIIGVTPFNGSAISTRPTGFTAAVATAAGLEIMDGAGPASGSTGNQSVVFAATDFLTIGLFGIQPPVSTDPFPVAYQSHPRQYLRR